MDRGDYLIAEEEKHLYSFNIPAILVMNKVDQQLLNELHAQFRHLDADGSGGLQQDDLEILTTQKLTEYRQRALKKYKYNLLDPSMVATQPTRGFSPIFPS